MKKFIKITLKSLTQLRSQGIFSHTFIFTIFIVLIFGGILKIINKNIFLEPFFVKNTFIFLEIFLILILILWSAIRNLIAHEFLITKDYLKFSELKKLKVKDKKFLIGTRVEKHFLEFLIFSFYLGILLMKEPKWTFKEIKKVNKKRKENKKNKLDSLYCWRKYYNEKTKEEKLFPFIITLNKN